jgi:hypothetical protein
MERGRLEHEVSQEIHQGFQADGGEPPERWTERGGSHPRVGGASLVICTAAAGVGEQAFVGVGNKRAEERRVAELERKVGQPGRGDRFF